MFEKTLPGGRLKRIIALYLAVILMVFCFNASAETSSISVFPDVSPSDWFFVSVQQVKALGIINGYGDGTFGPDDLLTRAQIFQILYNKYGTDQLTANPYSDVSSTDWYYDATCWARAKGLDEGIVTDKALYPEKTVTREEFVRILYNNAGKPSADPTVLNAYTDANDISNFASDAFAWAISNGIVLGVSDTALSPKASITRAQAATMIVRYLCNIDHATLPTLSVSDLPEASIQDSNILLGYRNIDGTTNADYVNNVSTVGKKAEYPTTGQADTPNANGYFTEANVDIEGAVLVYEALDYTHEQLGNYGMVWTTSDELEEYTLMRAKEAYQRYEAAGWDHEAVGYTESGSSKLHTRPDGSLIVVGEILDTFLSDFVSGKTYTPDLDSNEFYQRAVLTWINSPGHYEILKLNNVECCFARYRNVWIMCCYGEGYPYGVNPAQYASTNYYVR